VPIIQKYVLRAEGLLIAGGTPHPDVVPGAKMGRVDGRTGRGRGADVGTDADAAADPWVRRSVDDGRRRA
jgi:hypothetical protein